MSTKGSLFHSGAGRLDCKEHKLEIHIYTDMHESNDDVVVEFNCSTCYCSYKLLMTKHLGFQLVELLKQG